MAEVYIDKLSIDNFGPFYGEHTFDFSNLEGKCGILIGGKNGAGKTHILRALYLAIVGESGVGDLRKVETGSDATKYAFDKSINRRAWEEGQDTIRLQATISLDDVSIGSKKVDICREVRFRPNSAPVWSHTATRSGADGLIEDAQVIQKIRDAFLPRHLARFFFFDAERSQSINLNQKDIVEGVGRILGYHAYEELEDDLRKLISSKIPRVFSVSGGKDPETLLAEISGQVITVSGSLKARVKEKEALGRDLREVEAELLEVEDDLTTLGAVDPEEMEKSQQRYIELTEEKSKLESKLGSAWEQALPVSLLGSYRKELHGSLIAEERRREWEGAKSAVEPKIPMVKDSVFGRAPNEYTLTDDVEAFYLKRLEDALTSLFNPPPEGMPERVFITERNDISAQIRQRLAQNPFEIQDLAESCNKIDSMGAELRELNQKLSQMRQNTTAYKRGVELHEKRGGLIADRDRISKRLSEIESEIESKEVELADLKRQESIQQDIVMKAERGESLAALAARYREAAGEIRNRAANQMRKKISEEVGNLWVQITERDHEFRGMDFDSHWQCWLVKQNNKRISWDEINTSAGQRQVRMLAFYEALRRLAKLVPPLVVDTPLARLDKEVRTNVLDQLYLSGHQSIILSTNAEIDPDGELFDSVRDRFARAYTLNPHGSPDSADYEVHVTSDYFGHGLNGCWD